MEAKLIIKNLKAGCIKNLMLNVLVLLLLGALSAEEKMKFWDTQRKGANFFNSVPEEKWFKAASKLKIQWVRLAYGK